jgi:hypothetical protein
MRFHIAASRELAVAAEWYESRAAGLGGRFLDEVEAAVGLVAVGAVDEGRVGRLRHAAAG